MEGFSYRLHLAPTENPADCSFLSSPFAPAAALDAILGRNGTETIRRRFSLPRFRRPSRLNGTCSILENARVTSPRSFTREGAHRSAR